MYAMCNLHDVTWLVLPTCFPYIRLTSYSGVPRETTDPLRILEVRRRSRARTAKSSWKSNCPRLAKTSISCGLHLVVPWEPNLQRKRSTETHRPNKRITIETVERMSSWRGSAPICAWSWFSRRQRSRTGWTPTSRKPTIPRSIHTWLFFSLHCV